MMKNLVRQNAPHVRQSESVFNMMLDVVVALVPLYIMSFSFYGIRAVALGLFGGFCCVLWSAIGNLIRRTKPNLRDLTSLITGLIIPLLMPADIPYYVIFFATMVAILVVKYPFGGTGNNLFNPAAVGFASVALCWPNLVFRYPAAMQTLRLFGENTVRFAESPAASLARGAVPEDTVFDLLIGNTAGPMGTVNILVIIASGIFLIVRKVINWRTPVFFIATYSILVALFPRIPGNGFEAFCYELFGGMAIFGSFFLLSEPVTSPKRDFGKALYSIFAGIAVFLFRYFGSLEDGFVYALIVMNVFSPLFDRVCEYVLHIYRHKEEFLASFNDEKAKKSKKEAFLSAVSSIDETKEASEKEEATV